MESKVKKEWKAYRVQIGYLRTEVTYRTSYHKKDTSYTIHLDQKPLNPKPLALNPNMLNISALAAPQEWQHSSDKSRRTWARGDYKVAFE